MTRIDYQREDVLEVLRTLEEIVVSLVKMTPRTWREISMCASFASGRFFQALFADALAGWN
ncbi:MAG: hypothetical protein ABL949_16300 [Fimbriimonadaceae bacterium]